jgi:uncharacterized Zn finger protein
MQTEEMKLDGNALGGMMLELFGREMTAAIASCRSCGNVAELACVDVYVKAPGVVVRCRSCGNVLIKIVQSPERTWLDAGGIGVMEL